MYSFMDSKENILNVSEYLLGSAYNIGDRLTGCIGFNDPLRQYFSLYRAVSQRDREKKEKR